MRRSRINSLATVTAATLALTGAIGLAVVADGNPVRSVPLNDSGVWVTNDTLGAFGRMSKVARGLDAVLTPTGEGGGQQRLDVVQDGSTVIGYDVRRATLVSIDPVTLERTEGAIDTGARVAMAGGTLAVYSPTSGRIWATHYTPGTPLDNLGALSAQSDPVAAIGASGAMAVTEKGSVLAVDPSGKRVRIDPTDSGFGKPQVGDVGRREAVAVSAVGEHVVVADPITGTVQVDDGRPTDVGARGAVVQQPGPDRADVLFASDHALISVPLTGGPMSVLYSGGAGLPAAPLVLGDCSYAAWSGTEPKVTQACGGERPVERTVPREAGARSAPVFRTNQGQVVLNDTASGQVYDPTVERTVDNWREVRPQVVVDHATDHPDNATTSKVVVEPYTTAARPGRINILHPIDNAADSTGAILTIAKLGKIRGKGATATVLGDGQSVAVTFPASTKRVEFLATVSNGTGKTQAMPVTVTAVKDSANTPPTPGKTNTAVTVAAGGRIGIPMVWRDHECDPVTITSATANVGGVSISPDGQALEYAATADSKGKASIGVTVSDGRGGGAKATVPVTILGAGAPDPTPPLTQPDVVRAVVGKPAVVYPLDNDIPGADPTMAMAPLALLGNVVPRQKDQDALRVETDVATGKVTATSSAKTPGSYVLAYNATSGSAPSVEGRIRVDFVAQDSTTPILTPDTAVLHGQAPVLVDVLANDRDPLGRVLTVQSASPDGHLQVAVVGGRWLRIVATGIAEGKGSKKTKPASIRYTVTADGHTSVTSMVDVAVLPALAHDLPVTTADRASVRAGDSVRVPVLENDSTPGGALLALAARVEGAPAAGQLPVSDVADVKAKDVGTAYVAGNDIRYFAPASVRSPRSVVIPYVATTAAGDAAGGTLTVTIRPAPDDKTPDLAPTPVDLEARAASGETVTIPVSASGHDPDGDSTVVAGIASAPKLGRVVGFSPTSLTYQAYPTGATGTDTFTYAVSDSFGKIGTATIRVAVVSPQPPQPPVALPDQVTAAPGARVTVNPLENDLVTRGDSVALRLLSTTRGRPPGGATLPSGPSGAHGPVTAAAPKKGSAPTVIGYAVDGLGGSSAPGTITIRSQVGFENPPVVYDVVAPATEKPTTTVDVLARAFDPDGDSTKLTVHVDAPGASVEGGVLTLPVKKTPQAVGFTVTDAGGATSAAVAYVPASGSGGPYVPKGKVIAVPRTGTVTAALSEYVVSPAGKSLRMADAKSAVVATPASGLRIVKSGTQAVELAAAKDESGKVYAGPAALVLQLVEGTDKTVHTVSIPVQVGTPLPILRSCPTDPFVVSAAGEPLSLDITRLCHVWVPDGVDPASVRYAAGWQGTPLAGVTLSGQNTHILSLAGDGATQAGTGKLAIRIAGSEDAQATLTVAVRPVDPLTVTALVRDHVKAGESVTVDLSTAISSPLPSPQIAVRATQVPTSVASVSAHGSLLEVTTGATAAGEVVVPIEVTDAERDPKRDWVPTTVTLVVFAPPDKPTGVAPVSAPVNETISLAWTPGSANGAPVDYFDVESDTGLHQRCAASPCQIAGLPIGQKVRFHVSAHNEAGSSAWSDWSPEVTVDVKPDPVTGFVATGSGDHKITLQWTPASSKGSAVRGYRITGPVMASPGASSTSVSLWVPDNGVPYDFTIVAWNDAGDSAPVTASGYAYAAPTAPGNVEIQADGLGGVTVSWSASMANDLGDVTYGVTDSVSGSICSATPSTSCSTTVSLDNTEHSYTVTATNAHGLPASAPAVSYLAVGKPADFSSASASYAGPLQGSVTFRAGSSPAPSIVTLSVDGAQEASQPAPSDEVTWSFTVSKEGTHHVMLTNCTKPDDPQTCVTWSQDVVIYGAVDAPVWQALQLAGDNQTIEFTASASGTGGDLSWSVSASDPSASVHFSISGDCASSCQASGTVTGVAPGSSLTLTATVNRSVDGLSNTSTSPSITVPSSRSVDVSTGPDTGGAECGSAPCYPIYLTTSGFDPTIECSVAPSSSYSPAVSPVYAFPGTQTIGYAGPSVTVDVGCDGIHDSGSTPAATTGRVSERKP
ncbi:MAG: hypothetical protein IPH03_02710 [Tetrasphaera sp.]|nr:hypothetical protein [Tetrasphaera sp.]